MTLLKAIARAEGWTEFSKKREVLVFRKVGGQQYAALYDAKAIERGQYSDPELYPNDTVVVGDSQARRNLKDLFGIELDLEAMRQVAVQMVVGGADIETWEIDYKPGSVNYMDGINDTGRTRIERNTALKKNFEAHGIAVRQDIVPNVPHDGAKVLPVVQDFFVDVLKRHRNS